jgi:hypothetical protein
MALDLLPPRIANPELFALLTDILAVECNPSGNAKLRLRLIGEPTSWQDLSGLAEAQEALMPFVWALARRSLLLPLPARATGEAAAGHPTVALTSIYQQHITRRQRQRDQLFGIIAALNRDNIEPLLLKGARYLLAPPDSWGEARDMRDLDLLVRPEDGERAMGALAAAGYSTDPRPTPIDQHLPEMWHPGSPSAVEIHTHALAFSARKILATDEVWRRTIRSAAQQGSFFILPAEWHLLHALLNHQISDRGHARRMLAVKPLWEFAMLGSEVPDEGWRAIANHMAARGGADVLGSWIVQAARLYGLAYPAGGAISPAARAHAAATMARAGAPDWLRRGYFLADQLGFAFSRETLAVRYRIEQEQVSLGTVSRHLRFLVRHYRGRMLGRLFGERDRLP